jgi:release factor glutamine methyltransferase
MIVSEWMARGLAHLRERSVPEASANVDWIMAHVLRCGRAELKLHGTRALTSKQEKQFWMILLERAKRRPLAYLLGTQPFMGLDIQVDSDVLIPRPETEEVVAAAISLFENRGGEPLHMIEIGTGTGCVAIALAVAFPNSTIYATDISQAALKLAIKNAEAHHRGRHIKFISEDFFKPEARGGWADLVISNPPYIPTAEIDRLEPELHFEPRMALDGGKDGLDALRAIIGHAPVMLKPGGWIVLEIGHGQGKAVRAMLEQAGLASIEVRKDLQGKERIALGRK